MTECDEVAGAMRPPRLSNFDEALAFVRREMPDETHTVIDNVAWGLWREEQLRRGRAE
jgi:hypothetical protein